MFFMAFWLLLKYVIFVEPEHVTRTGVKVYVTDPSGVAMDVSQAEVSGLGPRHFKYEGVDNIPVSVLNTVSLAEAGFAGEAKVMGIAEGEHALAIDANTLKQRFVINADLGDKKIVAIYDSAADDYFVYADEIKGETFTLGLTGWVYKGVPVFVDEENESLWHRARGGLVVVQGENLGKRLFEIDGEVSSLDAWSTQHPDSLLLK